jgi:hypothetical protein
MFYYTEEKNETVSDEEADNTTKNAQKPRTFTDLFNDVCNPDAEVENPPPVKLTFSALFDENFDFDAVERHLSSNKTDNSPQKEEKKYAFISYSTKNQSYADAMRNLFNKHNINTWMAPYDIPAGSKYAAVITKAIRECSCFVLLLSNDSQASAAVDQEVELAVMEYKKSIITIELEKVVLNDSFTFYIHNKQIIAAHQIDEDLHEIRQILDAVKVYTSK